MHSPQGTNPSHIMWEPTPTSNKIGVTFDTHTLLGPWELAPFLTQTNYLQNLHYVLYHNKTLQGGSYVHNAYKCTHEHTMCDGDDRGKHVYAVKGAHEYVEYVSFKT